MNQWKHRFVCLLVCVGAGCGAFSEDSQPAPSNPNDELDKVTVPARFTGGMQVYEEHCSLCHDKGEGGAARLGSERTWAKRIDQGIDVLTQHAINGFEGNWGEMPAQAEKASAAEIRSAVEYMMYRAVGS